MRGWGTLASLVWAAAVAAYAAGYVTTLKPEGGELLLALTGFIAAAMVPLGLIWWIGRLGQALTAREDATVSLREEIRALKADVQALSRRLATAEARLAPPPAAATALDTPVAERQAEASVAETVPVTEADVEADPPPNPDDDQPALPLEGGSDGQGLSLSDTIRALNFPQDAQDKAGFAVLRRALQRHDLAKLLQASEDCLNLLAHQGIYTDDLLPAPATADEWRQFAKGGAARAELMPLTGITDTEALETVRAQMRGDPIFRDTALYFQRRFDRMLQDVAPEASDTDLLRLVDTRSGRAFVLLVQVGGLRSA